MTLTHKHNPDILKMYMCTENEVSRSTFFSLSPNRTDTQINATEYITTLHLLVAKNTYICT